MGDRPLAGVFIIKKTMMIGPGVVGLNPDDKQPIGTIPGNIFHRNVFVLPIPEQGMTDLYEFEIDAQNGSYLEHLEIGNINNIPCFKIEVGKREIRGLFLLCATYPCI